MAELDDRGVRRGTNELVLPEGEFCYTRDTTSGVTFVRCGPVVVNAQAQDEPVVYDVGVGRFRTVALSEAAQLNTEVPTGHYAVLHNPAAGAIHPTDKKEVPKELRIGQRIHIPGPTSFALWPRQHVKVIEGHQLRSNQYLIVRVYDEQAARDNWSRAVVKKAVPVPPPDGGGQPPFVPPETIVKPDESAKAPAVDAAGAVPDDLSVGRLLVIRGTQVSFYIPPTGIEVVADAAGQYVREALTLERLQYCILIDENGNKSYVRGADVVFPMPTQRFHEDGKGNRKFRPIELNGPIQGIHIKVIADYADTEGAHGEKGKAYKEGDELFITGATTPIYFPCEQHSAVKYDTHTKHFATAIPAGDGRYVLHRHTGIIKMVEGGAGGTMCLPDPRKEVFVRRVLNPAECESMYPDNDEVLAYNATLREIQAKAPTTRRGVVTEGEVKTRGGAFGGAIRSAGLRLGDAVFADASLSNAQTSAETAGDEFTRAASYTEPRTVTIGNDKFSGVPKINPWTGFAVMVVDTAGNRRVEIGPKRVLLAFNETLETLALSTGKPKNTDNLLRTAYLQLSANKVADILDAVTADHVNVQIKLALRVNFEGDDPTKWFTVANYVKLLCDHVRSVLKAAIRHMPVEEFFKRSEEFVRDTILGQKTDGEPRNGMFFEENSMRVYDVEIFYVKIGDEVIQTLLAKAQHEAVRTNVELEQEKRRLEATAQREELRRQSAEELATTEEHKAKLVEQAQERALRAAITEIQAAIARAQKNLDKQKAEDVVANAAAEAALARQHDQAEFSLWTKSESEKIRLEALQKEAQATIDQLQAVEKGFSEALLALGNQDTLVKIAEAMSVQNFIGGKNAVDVVQAVFKGTPLEKLSELIQKRALPASSNGTAPRAES